MIIKENTPDFKPFKITFWNTKAPVISDRAKWILSNYPGFITSQIKKT